MDRRRGKEDEDSGSDWDSMSEIAPPPALKHGTQANGPPPQSLPPVLPRERTTLHVEPQVDIMQTKENPPYNFKPEIKSPTHASDPVPRPGKQKKGKLYDPQAVPQKHVTFGGKQVAEHGSRGNGGVPDSDADDSLYSTVKPNHRGRGRSQVPVPVDPEEHEAPSKPKKATRLNPSQLTQKPMEGVDNHAFVEEDVFGSSALSNSTSALRDTHLSDPRAGSPQVTLKTSLPADSTSYYSQFKAPKNKDFQMVMQNEIPTTKDCPPPLIMISQEPLLESAGKRPVDAVNRALGELFALITIPFTCLILLIHYLIRFIIQGVVRPLVVDSTRLLIEYLVQPLITGIVKPLLSIVHVISVSAAEISMVLMQPVIALLQATRLVEVHNTKFKMVKNVPLSRAVEEKGLATFIADATILLPKDQREILIDKCFCGPGIVKLSKIYLEEHK